MRRFTHYIVLSWAFTLGALAISGIGYMIYAMIFLGAAADFGMY